MNLLLYKLMSTILLFAPRTYKIWLFLFPSYLLNLYECANEQISPWDFFTFRFRLFYIGITSEDLKNMPLSLLLPLRLSREGVYDGTASASLVPSACMNLRAGEFKQYSSRTHNSEHQLSATWDFHLTFRYVLIRRI